jgi:uncharacterized protein (UPF0333 family)/uncharacterized membrane protein required for colicin V production
MAAISGVIRSGIGWVKAIITKYARKAIDQLVKLIMTPIKGVTTTINDTIEQILNMVFCSFGNIESLISNMIEDLLNTLVDSAVNSVFGCLDTLVDGILNEIMGEVLGLVENIMGVIESVAGIIGGFGDLLGEAINAVLDFLGISCGGAGDCATDASNALTTTFNNPGEFGLTDGIKSSLQGGLDGINSATSDIDKSTAEANAEAAEYAKGVDLGTANVPGVSTDNQALRNAFTTANNMAASAVSNVFDFCNNLSAGNDGSTGSSTIPTNPGDDGPYTPSTTYAVVIGKEEDKYDAEYSMFPVKESAKSGETQQIKIRRDNTHEDGVIIFVVHLSNTDTARVVGITEGLSSGGDLSKGTILGDKQYAKMPKKSKSTQQFPKKKRVISSEKVFFPAGTNEVIVSVPTLLNEPPKDEDGIQNGEEVTYTASIYRSSDDLDKDKYPYKNLPHTSHLLHSSKLKITFAKIPDKDPITSDIFLPPEILKNEVNYVVNNVSVVAGQPAQFEVIRNPVVDYTTKVKCTTGPDNSQTYPAVDGTHYTGGSGILTFKSGESKKIFSVPTLEVSSLVNETKCFQVTFVDNELPVGVGSNLGGKGVESGTEVGEGITAKAVINYDSTVKPSPICEAEILVTSENTPCIVQEEDVPLNIGIFAKTSVPGYVLSYEWQRTLDPNGTWTTVNNGVRNETITEKVTTFGPSDVTINGTTLDAWETSDVNQSVSITYTGATTNKLTVEQPSYLILDQEYYRCVITATPVTPSAYTPTLTHTTGATYVGITKENVYSSTVNCAPPGTLQDGSLVTYTSAASIAGAGESFELFENYKPTLTSKNVPGDKLSAKFLSDGSGIQVSGEANGGAGSIKLRFEWDDNPKTSGQAVGQLHVAGKTFSQGKKEKGSTTKTIYVEAGKTYKFQYKGQSSDQGYKVISDGQVIIWDDDNSKGKFDENARLSILEVTGKESSIITEKINNFVAGFYPKAIGEYAQHTYGSALNWTNLESFYEGDFTLVGGSGTGLVVKAKFQALSGIGGNPNNTKYTILTIINPGENYVAGDELSFPDQGGYGFSGMGNLVRILNPDFGIDDEASLCEVVEPTQDVPEDVIPDDPNPDPIPEDEVPEVNPPTPDDEDIDVPVVPVDDPDDDDDGIPPNTPVIIGEDGGVVSVPIPPGLPRYKQPPLIPVSGPGTGAIVKAELDEDGALVDIVVKSKGIGYTPSSGFDQCGILSNMIITNVGGYYESSPTVYVNNDPTIAVAAIQDGRLAEIRIVNPQNKVYSTIPDVRIQGDGFGGSAKAVIRFVPCPDVPDEYLNVVNKYNDSKLGTVSVVDCP